MSAETIRSALKPHQWKITWTLFFAPIVVAYCVAFDDMWWRLLIVAGLVGVFAVYVVALDRFRNWLDGAPGEKP